MTSPESIARHRAVEKLKPSYWWLGDFDTGHSWCRVDIVIEGENVITGKRFVRILGTDPGDRTNVELTQLRGFSVLSVTEMQALRCGLSVPDEVTP